MFTRIPLYALVFLASFAPADVWARNGARIPYTPISHQACVDCGACDGCGGAIGCCESACDCCDCDCFSCNMCPCTYGYVEGLIFDRNNRARNQPLVLDLNNNDVLLSAGDLNFDWGGGVRAVVGRQLHHCTSIEFGYLGIFDQSAGATVFREDSLRVPGDLGSGQVNNFFFADQINIGYESSVHSAEANLVHCWYTCNNPAHCHSFEVLAGFRYLNLNEDFTLTSFDSAEGTTVYGVRTDNDLYGGQLGGRARLCYGRVSFESVGKAGIYGNDVRQQQDALIDFPGVVVRPARSASGGTTAFVGELNFTGIYQLTPVWGVRGGYNLLWIEGVALAPDQLDFTNTPDSGTGLTSSSGVFLHGASLGLEARW
jgi:hypothetical protein